MDAIKERRSIRKYKQEPIEKKEIDEIIKAGMFAPSAKNRQPWKYIIYSHQTKEALLDEMERGLIKERDEKNLLPNSQSGISDAFNSLEIMREAPILIIILNTNGQSPYKEINTDDRVTELCDTLSIGASVQNMLLTATEKGLGTLWIANTCFAYNELINYIKTSSQLVGAIALGYPNENPNPRPRKDFDTIAEYR